MSDNTEIKIGGNATGAVAAMAESTAAVKDGVAAMNASLGKIGGIFEGIQSKFLMLSAVLAGGKAFNDSIKAANNWNAQAGVMAKQMGITTQQASVLAVGLHSVGVSTDTYKQAAMLMTRQMSANEGAFKTLGVAIKDTHTGALRPIGDIMSEVNSKLGSIHNATERNTAGMKVYGRGWAEVQGVLKLNSAAMKEAQETAVRLHLIVGPEGVAQTKQYAKEQRELSLVAESLEIQVGNTLLPALVKLGAWFGEIGPQVADVFSKAMEVVGTVINELGDVFNAWRDEWSDVCQSVKSLTDYLFGNSIPKNLNITDAAIALLKTAVITLGTGFQETYEIIGGTVRAAVELLITFNRVATDALTLNWGAIQSDWENGMAKVGAVVEEHAQKIAKITQEYKQKVAAAWSPPAKAKDVGGAPEADAGPHIDFSKPKKGKKAKSSGGGSDQVAAWKEELEQKKEAEGDFFKDDLSMEEAFWQSKLSTIKGNGKQQVAERRAVEKELYDIHKQQAQQQRQMDDESIAQRERMGQQDIETARASIEAQKDLGQINDVQALQSLQQLKDQEYQLELKSLQDKLALYQQDKVAKQKLLDEIALLEKKHAATEQQTSTQIAIAQKKQTESMLSPISSAIDKTVTGMIMGTQTLRQAVANIGQNILGEFVSMLTKRAVAWAAAELGMTQSTETGTALRSVLQTTSSNSALTTKAKEATGTVGANAAEAASGAAASVAAIPFVGWAMAAGVFASTMATVMGAKSTIPSARGGFDIPAGVNPITQLHEQEMVLPAEQANAVRDMANNGGGAGGMHLHVHAVDAHSVQRLFANNGQALARVLKEQHRRFSS